MKRKVVAVLCAVPFSGLVLVLLLRGGLPSDPSPVATREHLDPNNPCGIVSALVASRVLDRPLDPAQARKGIVVDGLGRTSVAELVKGLQRLGFGALGVRLTPAILNRLDAPIILYVHSSHFLVVLPIGDGTVVRIDPPHPPTVESMREIARSWRGEAVIVRGTQEEARETAAILGIIVPDRLGDD